MNQLPKPSRAHRTSQTCIHTQASIRTQASSQTASGPCDHCQGGRGMCEMFVMQWTWVCHTRGDCRHALGSLSLAPLAVWSYASSFCSTPGSKPAECSTCAYSQLAWPLQRSLGLQDHGVIARRPCCWVEAAACSVVLFRRHQSRRLAGGSGVRGVGRGFWLQGGCPLSNGGCVERSAC